VSFYLLLACGFLIADIHVYRNVFAPRDIEVTVLHAGKGSAALIRSRSGKTLLVDTGPDASILRALGTTLPPWQRSLDATLLTSSAAGFAGGLKEVSDQYQIGTSVRFGAPGSKGMESMLAVWPRLPYGTSLLFDTDITITILAPGSASIVYDSNLLSIASSTPPGTYVLK
jgi:hypothetical protein